MAAIFIDRDGVVNSNRADHVKSWEEFTFLPGAAEALARLTNCGHQVFIVTNQAIINRGVVSRETVDDIHRRMQAEVRRRGGQIAAVMVCPHEPHERCSCRKPMPGLLMQAQREHGVALRRAYLVGDFTTDVEAARAAGCTAILVRTGRGNEALRTVSPKLRQRYPIARDLSEAVRIIEELEGHRHNLEFGQD